MNKNEDYYDNTIDFEDLFKAIKQKKLFIILITLSVAFVSLTISINLPNIYKSSSLLAPSSTNESLNSQLSSFSSVANLVGVNIPSGEITKSQEAVERIKSFNFFTNYFLPNIQLENLMAVDEWIPIENVLVYDNDIYNFKKNMWVREPAYPKKTVPSNQEAFEIYKDILNIDVNQSSSFVKISIIHKSPLVAKKWLEIIIKNINESMREIDIKNAESSISYLNNYYEKINFQSLKDSVSNLQESQMQTLMLASSNADYIFKVIDKPIAPEKKFKPNRAIICILGTLLGLIFSILYTLITHYLRK